MPDPTNPTKPVTFLNRVRGPSGKSILSESPISFLYTAHLFALLAPISDALANVAAFASAYPDLSTRFASLEANVAKAMDIRIEVADPAGRLALNVTQVQDGDFISQLAPAALYIVADQTKLGTEDAFLRWTVPGPESTGLLIKAGAPSDSIDGVNGSWYLDPISQTLYGPKTAGSWTGDGIDVIVFATEAQVASLGDVSGQLAVLNGQATDFGNRITVLEAFSAATEPRLTALEAFQSSAAAWLDVGARLGVLETDDTNAQSNITSLFTRVSTLESWENATGYGARITVLEANDFMGLSSTVGTLSSTVSSLSTDVGTAISTAGSAAMSAGSAAMDAASAASAASAAAATVTAVATDLATLEGTLPTTYAPLANPRFHDDVQILGPMNFRSQWTDLINYTNLLIEADGANVTFRATFSGSVSPGYMTFDTGALHMWTLLGAGLMQLSATDLSPSGVALDLGTSTARWNNFFGNHGDFTTDVNIGTGDGFGYKVGGTKVVGAQQAAIVDVVPPMLGGDYSSDFSIISGAIAALVSAVNAQLASDRAHGLTATPA